MFTYVAARRYDRKHEVETCCAVADEAPVSIAYNGVPHLVLMASPGELDDLAIGFSITDGICSRDEISGAMVSGMATGWSVDVRLAPAAFERFLRSRSVRHQRSYTSCGVCGIETLSDLPRLARTRSAGSSRFDRRAIPVALEALPHHQTCNRLTGAMHAAAWAQPDGTIVMVREDVGRHNALDKLIGALVTPGAGFCLITSRCSFEMVHKAAAADFQMLVSISAPTTLAITEASRLGLTLVALARADNQTAYAGEHRFDSAEMAKGEVQ